MREVSQQASELCLRRSPGSGKTSSRITSRDLMSPIVRTQGECLFPTLHSADGYTETSQRIGRLGGAGLHDPTVRGSGSVDRYCTLRRLACTALWSSCASLSSST